MVALAKPGRMTLMPFVFLLPLVVVLGRNLLWLGLVAPPLPTVAAHRVARGIHLRVNGVHGLEALITAVMSGLECLHSRNSVNLMEPVGRLTVPTWHPSGVYLIVPLLNLGPRILHAVKVGTLTHMAYLLTGVVVAR